MGNRVHISSPGILRQFKAFIARNRLGELLVIRGIISRQDLRFALKIQKETQTPLGEIFLKHAMISRRQLAMILCRQWALRMTAAVMFYLASISGMNAKKARADDLSPVLAVSSGTYQSAVPYPGLFGSSEKRNGNLKPFTKWTGMVARFDRQKGTANGQRAMREWQENLAGLEGLPLKEMARRVNSIANAKPYINDSRNWGMSDYWETPVEFMERGGDCEDFAIAKYNALRSLGVPEERLRVAIVHDTEKNIPHAVLAVYTEDGIYVLDNQIKTLVSASDEGRYRPIFSINRTGWWLHTEQSSTEVASR